MNKIELNANGWSTIIDFYDDLLKEIGAPSWHGKNVNAIIDSMIWGDINCTEPPYKIMLHGVRNLPTEIQSEIDNTISHIAKARIDYLRRKGREPDVHFCIVS